MAIITMDGHEITKLVLTPASGSPVTKNLVAANSFGSSDEGKVVVNGSLASQTSQNISANGTYDTTTKNSVVVDVQSSLSVDDWDIYGKEQVKTWGETLNLSDDTNFDSLTPSTSASTITINDAVGESFSVDFANYMYIILQEQYIKASYASPADKAFAKQVSISVYLLYRSLNNQNVSSVSVLQNMTYQYNNNGEVVQAPNGTSYGIYGGNGLKPSFASTSGASTTVTVPAPTWSMRGSTSYSPVATLEAIDSSNSKIEYRFTAYRMPVNTLAGTAKVEAEYIVSNDGLRSTGS